MKDGLRKVRIHFEFVMASFARKLLSGLAQKSCKCVFTRCDFKNSLKNFSQWRQGGKTADWLRDMT